MNFLSKKVAGVILGCIFSTFSWAQGGGQTPYSLVGLGELANKGLIHNQFVGGQGVAYGNIWRLNYQNPAMLTLNSFTMFGVGISGDFRTIRSEDNSVSNAGGDLEYIAFGIPVISNKWTIGFGLLPFSKVNYSVRSTEFLTEDSLQIVQEFAGEGGINQANLSTGFSPFKGFSVGFSASFLFGPIDQSATVLSSLESNVGSGISERVSYSDFAYMAGLFYTRNLNDKSNISVGFTYDFATELRGRLNREAFEVDSNSGVVIDTLVLIDNQPVGVDLPSETTVGISYTRTNRWKIGAEFSTRNWDNFRDVNGNNEDLTRSTRIALGGEIIPKYNATSGYLNRVTYMTGINYRISQVELNNNQVNELGINFGFSLPVARISSIEVGFEYGQRGNISDNLIEEEFFKFYFGVSFNDIQWKKRPRFN